MIGSCCVNAGQIAEKCVALVAVRRRKRRRKMKKWERYIKVENTC
jgi:hypothetical protein